MWKELNRKTLASVLVIALMILGFVGYASASSSPCSKQMKTATLTANGLWDVQTCKSASVDVPPSTTTTALTATSTATVTTTVVTTAVSTTAVTMATTSIETIPPTTTTTTLTETQTQTLTQTSTKLVPPPPPPTYWLQVLFVDYNSTFTSPTTVSGTVVESQSAHTIGNITYGTVTDTVTFTSMTQEFAGHTSFFVQEYPLPPGTTNITVSTTALGGFKTSFPYTPFNTLNGESAPPATPFSVSSTIEGYLWMTEI
jgi:hypothetical protein